MLYYKHVRKLSTRLRDLDSEAQAFAQARLNHVRTVRVFANETLEAHRFQRVRKQAASCFLSWDWDWLGLGEQVVKCIPNSEVGCLGIRDCFQFVRVTVTNWCA